MKIAWVLSGGGALGSVEVGMMQALLEKGVRPSALYGTSAGALNVFGLSHGGIDGLTKLWGTINKREDVFNDNFGLLLFKKGLYKAKPLTKKLQSIQSRPTIPFEVCTLNLTTGNKEYFGHESEDIVKMTVASASIPGVVSPTMHNDDAYVDGGVVENVPLRKAIEDGAHRIYVLLCSPIKNGLDEGWRAGNLLTVLFRSLGAMRRELFLDDIMYCLKVNQTILAGTANDKRLVEIVVIAPNTPVADSMDFSQKAIRLGMRVGYERALEVLSLPAMLKPEDLKIL